MNITRQEKKDRITVIKVNNKIVMYYYKRLNCDLFDLFIGKPSDSMVYGHTDLTEEKREEIINKVLSNYINLAKSLCF